MRFVMTAHILPDRQFRAILHADAPASEHQDKLALYGWLVGSWEMDVVRHNPDGQTMRSDGEIHFGWVLGGRAIQDVWIAPRPSSGLPPQMFGTTLRIYDPGQDAWHILWSDPVKRYYTRQIGRAQGADIVQTGTNAAGENVRWRFTKIQPSSFDWIGERGIEGTQKWLTEVEFFARRITT
jgi:hypothetical protein